jgi:hypothetical protein
MAVLNLIEKLSSEERKKYPVQSGVFAYFRDAIFRLARVSYDGNEKHNPGEPLHWARDKSSDHMDCVARHLLAYAPDDHDDAIEEHLANTAWRSMAELQIYLEKKYNISPPPRAQ